MRVRFVRGGGCVCPVCTGRERDARPICTGGWEGGAQPAGTSARAAQRAGTEGRGVSDQYGVRDAACPLSTRGGAGGGGTCCSSSARRICARGTTRSMSRVRRGGRRIRSVTAKRTGLQTTNKDQDRTRQADSNIESKTARGSAGQRSPPALSFPRTNRTSLVPPLVLSGHAASPTVGQGQGGGQGSAHRGVDALRAREPTRLRRAPSPLLLARPGRLRLRRRGLCSWRRSRRAPLFVAALRRGRARRAGGIGRGNGREGRGVESSLAHGGDLREGRPISTG